MSAPTDYHGLSIILWDIVLSFGHVTWKSSQRGSFLPFPLCQCSCWSSIWTLMPATLSCQLSCGSGATVLVPCLVVLPALLFFYLSLQCHLWLQSHLWITSIPAGHSVPQFWSMDSHRIWALTACLCAPHLVLLFLFLFPIALMVIHMPWISSSMFVSWLFFTSQSAMNIHGPGLFSILMLYLCILHSIIWSICDRLTSSFLNTNTSGLWSVIMLTLWVKQ